MKHINSLRNNFFCASPAEKSSEDKTRRKYPKKEYKCSPHLLQKMESQGMTQAATWREQIA